MKPAIAIPVYLPSWLPRAESGGPYWAVSAQATADGYTVSFNWSPRPVAVNAPAPTVMASLVGSIQGGPIGSLTAARGGPWSWRPTAGTPLSLPGGKSGTFYPGWGIEWQEGGWSYAAVNLLTVPGTPSDVMPLVQGMLGALGSAANPIGGGTTGSVLQVLAPDNGAMTLTWDQ